MSEVRSTRHYPKDWQRYTLEQKILRLFLIIIIVIAIVQSVRHVMIIPEFLYDAPEQIVDLFKRMWPVDWQHYPTSVHSALIETIHIATVGTLLSLIVALPVALLAANNVTPNKLLNQIARFILVTSRSVNSLVWALLFIAIFGPGPLAGMFAIAFRSIGFTGKLVSEAIEEAPSGPIEALLATGGSKFSTIWYGYWPFVKPAFWSIILLRWDINIRESTVLGLVGAGGVGMLLDTAMNLFQWPRVAMILIAIFCIVIVAEIIITAVRKRIL